MITAIPTITAADAYVRKGSSSTPIQRLVYHVTADCPKVAYEPQNYAAVPAWLVGLAKLERCKTSGPCHSAK